MNTQVTQRVNDVSTGSESLPGSSRAATRPENSSKRLNFRVAVSDDRLKVLVECRSMPEDLGSLAAGIREKLDLLEIKDPPTEEQLKVWIQSQDSPDGRLGDAVVVEGEPPVPPRDGRIEWAGDFFKTGYAVDLETGRLDYRERAAKSVVKENQRLARIIPPESGQDGKDVFGKSIRTKKPKNPRIRSGPGVRFEEKERAYYAGIAGRVRWQDGVLSVDNVYSISGSVGLSTGNIVHPGAVIVQQDVTEGSLIEAKGDIEVMGVLEAATIRTEGNLIVHGGITGADGRTISVAGEVHAKFILEAHIRSLGDIVVTREIVHSDVKTRGAVLVRQGRIVGGEIVALEGIDVGEAGSEAIVRTILTTDEDYLLPQKLEEKQTEIDGLEHKLESIHAVIGPLLQKPQSIPNDKKQAVKKLALSAAEMVKTLKTLRTELAEITNESRERQKHRLVVHKKIHPETRLGMSGEKLIVRKEHEGPLKAVLSKGYLRLKVDRS